MDKKISYIKERVLEIADYKEVGKEKFCESIGMTYGNFKGVQKKTALNSDAIDRILSLHPDINPEWLISGKGQMIREIERDDVFSEPRRDEYIRKVPDTNCQSTIDALNKVIRAQDKTIQALEQVIASKSGSTTDDTRDSQKQ